MKTSVMQMAYVTRNLENSVNYWIEATGAGPFFFSDVLQPAEQVFRGESVATQFKIAVAYSGELQIEVVQPLDGLPSMFTEVLLPQIPVPQAGLFHHVQLAHGGYDAACGRLGRLGAEQCFQAIAPGVGRICFFDARHLMGCYAELVETTAASMAARAEMRRQHERWNGENPCRSYGDLIRSLSG